MQDFWYHKRLEPNIETRLRISCSLIVQLCTDLWSDFPNLINWFRGRGFIPDGGMARQYFFCPIRSLSFQKSRSKTFLHWSGSCCCMPLVYNRLMDSCGYVHVCKNTLLATMGGLNFHFFYPPPPIPPKSDSNRYRSGINKSPNWSRFDAVSTESGYV